MSTESVAALRVRLAGAGYDVSDASFESRSVLVGRTSQFRWRWMASRLHTFVVVVDFGASALDSTTLDRFLDVSTRYARANKGGLPAGLQTGSAVVAVALSEHRDPVAVTWASRVHGRRFGAMTYPVAIDDATGTVVHPTRVVVGALFANHLRVVADDVVGGAFVR